MSNQLVCLEIGKGDFEQGFPVVLRIWQENQGTATIITGNLPPVPIVFESYQSWQSSYQERNFNAYRKIDPIEGQVTNISIVESALDLQSSFNDWLNSGNKEFRVVRDKLLEIFSQNSQKIRLIIQTDEVLLYQLPWHLWDMLDEHYELEPSFSLMNVKSRDTISKNLTEKVRILVILGDSTNINVDADLQIFKEHLPDAEIKTLVVVRRADLSKELWEKNWDILFFAGHSDSDLDTDQGRIYINATESITIQELKDGLENAIQHGLKLAIFNSCLGLGIAKDLASLQMPAIIVMRERIPDLAAQRFLEYFLTAFATKRHSLKDSVREARKRLKETVDAEHPCASWLPILFENPTQESPTWIGLRKEKEQKKKFLSISHIFALSVVAGMGIMGIRWFGLLQPVELLAYDHLMQIRPLEKPDSRILIVEAKEDDIRKYGYPLPDKILAQLLDKINSHQPKVIGLNIYRDQSVGKKNEALATHFKNNEKLISVCYSDAGKESILPPTASPTQQLSFDNLLEDNYGIIRRAILTRTENSASRFDECNTHYSFSFFLAFRYLANQGISIKPKNEDWQFGQRIFRRLKSRIGGYQNLHNWGNQILIHYRANPQVARTVTLNDILTGRFHPSWIQGKIVLIGMNAPSVNDGVYTPIGEISKLLVHAHIISQILSTVEDKRPLLEGFPQEIDAFWIWIWSLTGGVIIYFFHTSPWRLGISISLSFIILYGICFGAFLQGIWLPLIPCIFSFSITGLVVILYKHQPSIQSST